jgi:hypothetical protein
LNLVQEILYELLEATAPKTLLCVSAEGVVSSVDQYVAHNADCALTTMAPAEATDLLAEQGRFDYAVLSGALEDVPHDDGAALIARLRDLHCHRFALACRHADAHHREGAWSEAELLAMALSLHRRIREDGVWFSVYTYDIDTFNRRREWNNPEHWANPDNFRRYRWHPRAGAPSQAVCAFRLVSAAFARNPTASG